MKNIFNKLFSKKNIKVNKYEFVPYGYRLKASPDIEKFVDINEFIICHDGGYYVMYEYWNPYPSRGSNNGSFRISDGPFGTLEDAKRKIINNVLNRLETKKKRLKEIDDIEHISEDIKYKIFNEYNK